MKLGGGLDVVERDGDGTRAGLSRGSLDALSERVEMGRERLGSIPIQRGREGHGSFSSRKGGAGEVNSKVCSLALAAVRTSDLPLATHRALSDI